MGTLRYVLNWAISRFLRPVAVQNLKPEEASPAERPVGKTGTTGGFRSDAFVEDLSEPAYTRKYMD